MRVPSGPLLVHEADVVERCGQACRKRRSGRVTQAGHYVASRSRAIGHCEFSKEQSLYCGMGGRHSVV